MGQQLDVWDFLGVITVRSTKWVIVATTWARCQAGRKCCRRRHTAPLVGWGSLRAEGKWKSTIKTRHNSHYIPNPGGNLSHRIRTPTLPASKTNGKPCPTKAMTHFQSHINCWPDFNHFFSAVHGLPWHLHGNHWFIYCFKSQKTF